MDNSVKTHVQAARIKKYVPEAISFRYITQTEDSPDFSPNAWRGYIDCAKEGCAVACTSMAFSAIGIDLLPCEICEINSKYDEADPSLMFWDHVGKSVGLTMRVAPELKNLDQALDDHLNDPQRYTPPIIRDSTQKQHYILVTGRNENGDYTVADPRANGKTLLLRHETPLQIEQYMRQKP